VTLDVVDGRFEVLALVGEGGMGRVFRAVDRTDGSPVALKVLRDGPARGDTVVRFGREVAALVRLRHPAIIRYIAHGTTTAGLSYLAMQWVDGEDLRNRIKRARLTFAETIAVATRLASALVHTHAQGLMHRDVKPANVLLPGGELDAAILIDFGLARGGDDELTQAGTLVGTPGFLAPEQIRNEAVLPAGDVFSLGCLIFLCLAGVTPFAASNATAVLARVLFEEPQPLASVADVPPVLAELIDAMLQKKPEARPSMRRVLDVLSSHGQELLGQSGVARATSALSQGEQRIVSVLVAGEARAGKEDETLRRVPGPVNTNFVRGELAARFGAELTLLPNGALVLVLTAEGTATDVAERAAECALALVEGLPGVPIALATGRAELGSSVLVGEAIDRASRLVQQAGGAGVRIDDVTAALLEGRFVLESDEHGHVLRGRGGTDAIRTLLGKPTPCVGRDVEIALLEGILAQSIEERAARVVLVTGPAGVGKSRLRYEFLRRVRARGEEVELWVARADSVGAGAPFGLAAQMIRRTARVLEGEALADCQDKLRARVAERVPKDARHRVASFLAEMVNVHFSDEGDVQLQAARRDPLLMGDQMRRAFVDFVAAESERRPLVMVLEDLHWGDLPTIQAVDMALRLFADRAILVLALSRPEVEGIFPGLFRERGVQPIPLAPLQKKASERLVRAALGETSDDFVRRLVERAGGNAFYLEELIRAVAEGRSDEAPPTVVAMVQSRLDTLEPEARRTLRAASVFGQVCWASGVRALLGTDPVDTLLRLDDLAGRELLTRRAESRLARDVEFTFRHALIREGAYAMLTDRDKALGHRLAAEWLESAGEAAAVVVAEHYALGGEMTRAAAAYLRAAEQALERSDLERAIEHAQLGVGCGADGELLGALRNVQAQAHHWRGETVKMEHAASEAISLVPRSSSRWADAMALLGVAKQRLGHTGELDSVARELLQGIEAANGDRASLARASGRVASLLFFAGKHALATTLLDAAEAAARDGGAEVEARIHQARAPQARQAGRPAEALGHTSEAEAAFRAAGDERNVCMMTGIRGFALSELGAFDESEPVLREALAMGTRLGLTMVVAAAQSNLAVVLFRLGRPKEAEALERTAVNLFHAQDRRHEGGSRMYLAQMLAALGSPVSLAEAEAEVRAAVTLLETAPALRPFALGVLSDVLLRMGRGEEALATAREAMEWLDSGGKLEEGEAIVRLAYARALDAAGDRAAAREVIARARERLLERADGIHRPEWRRTFLENVPEHASTLALAEEWQARDTEVPAQRSTEYGG
jgi:eukaryotic-like serine/threonine-protein kinase